MWCKLLESAMLSFCVNPFPRPLGSVSRILHFHLQLTRVRKGCILGAHLKVIAKGIEINKPLDRFLSAWCLPGSLSKPNAKPRWEASIKCSEGRWKGAGGRCLSHDAQQLLNARQISTDWEVSSETQMCEKERESEGKSHTCSYLFNVYKNFYGLGAGPWMSLEKAYSPAMLCFQDLFRLKCCENHWLLLQCNHTLAGKWGPYFWDTL